MRTKAIFAVLLIFAVFGVSAQDWGPGFRYNNNRRPEQLTITGNLGLVNGMIALESDNKTYYVGGLERYVGFIEGLKEGAEVTLEGFALAVPGNPEYWYLRAAKLTLNGKEYELAGPRHIAGSRPVPPPGHGRMRGYPGERFPRGPEARGFCRRR
jgi:hypothetical protein